jgi:hypothetical protein
MTATVTLFPGNSGFTFYTASPFDRKLLAFICHHPSFVTATLITLRSLDSANFSKMAEERDRLLNHRIRRFQDHHASLKFIHNEVNCVDSRLRCTLISRRRRKW